MDMGGPPADDDQGTPVEARWVVAFRGTRAHARVFGSVLGPSVLVSGPEDEPWQVLLMGPDSAAASTVARAIAWPWHPQGNFGLVDPAALALGRSEASRSLVVPTSPTTHLPWTWTRQAGGGLDAHLLDALVDEVAALSTAGAADVRAVLLARWEDGDPVRELVALLGLPVTAADVLEVPDADVPRLGEALLPAEGRRHIAALMEATSATHGALWAEIAAGIDRRSRRTTLASLLGVMWMVLGTALGLVGALGLVLGNRTGASVLGVESPLAWIAMAAALVWFGRWRWRRARRPVTTNGRTRDPLVRPSSSTGQ